MIKTTLKILGVLVYATVLLWLILFISGVALAAEDLGDGACRQGDEIGYWNSTTADDDGCITPSEYEFLFSAQNLKDMGVIEDYTVNDDGTTTLHYSGGYSGVTKTNPLDRPQAVSGDEGPTAKDFFDSLTFWHASVGIQL